MSQNYIVDFMPRLYRRLLPGFFRNHLEPERHATCDSCAMCPPKDEVDLTERSYFSPQLKCCTYYPSLPNYLVGGLLAETGSEPAEGRRRVRRRIELGSGITPLGIGPTPAVLQVYENDALEFGRSDELRCPYFHQASGRCTIWSFRDARCSTFFCKFNRGKDGLLFWHGLREYLTHIQRALARHVLEGLGWDAATVDALECGNPSDDTDTMWRSWCGRETDLYIAAFDIVSALEQSSFNRLVDADQDGHLSELSASYRRMMDPTIPARLRRNPDLVVHSGTDGGVVVVSFSPFDPVRLPTRTYRILDEFDGTCSWQDTVESIAQARGPVPGVGLITALYRHRILIGAENPKGSANSLS
jgi:hypothetical protein